MRPTVNAFFPPIFPLIHPNRLISLSLSLSEELPMESLTILSPLFLSSPSSLIGGFKPPRSRVFLQQTDSEDRVSARKIFRHWNQFDSGKGKHMDVDYAPLIRMLGKNKMPDTALQLFLEIKSEGFVPSCATLSALMLCYADNGLFSKAQAIWYEIINSSFVPDIGVVSDLMDAYGKMGHFDEVTRILHEVTSRDFNLGHEVYSLAISCFGKGGQLEMMETAMKEMASSGFKVDSVTGNEFVRYYSIFGSLTEMESAYGRLKRSRILVEREAIRAMAFAYISKRKFYKLGEFLRDVGLGRRNTGNLLWNLLLLSYAANFKMKSLQREFLNMLEAGFSPDLTTFNIRALAFSRMCMFWDLHLSIEHMRHEKVIPDLVTYGCIIDAYLNRRLGRNLSFVLKNTNIDSFPQILTDPIVFEVLGKGDFHSSSEALLESKRNKDWTYSKLIRVYLKKQYRSNQIFWNY
ncbi:pentatricopeptide repeat (PPR) superfamily protein [Tasmannia lanceolata]|uniref:pentatricopeptide repeat (PPR) superfamily protein n=1 Tax=Tasmannia lanceolata TaxID=3420 RepID=UPI00406379B5